MVDLVITAANVQRGTNAVTTTGTAGAAVTAGQCVYFDKITKRYLLADSNSATVAARRATAIALHAASAGQPLTVQTSGDLTLGATMVAGTSYYLSDTPGGICPVADVGTGEWVNVIGVAKSTTAIQLTFAYPGVSL